MISALLDLKYACADNANLGTRILVRKGWMADLYSEMQMRFRMNDSVVAESEYKCRGPCACFRSHLEFSKNVADGVESKADI